MQRKGKRKEKKSAAVARARIINISKNDEYERGKAEMDAILKQIQKAAEEKEQVVKQLIADCEVSKRVIEQIKNLFSNAGVEIDTEQLMIVIINFKDIFISCKTIDDITQRIHDLGKVAYFK